MREKVKGFAPKRVESKRKFNGGLEKDRLYKSAKWQAYRKKFLAINYRCYACGSASTVVDHGTPHKGDVSLFWKLDNLLPLCAICHNTVTTLFDRNYKPGGSINDKLTWIKWKQASKDLLGKIRVKIVPIDYRAE